MYEIVLTDKKPSPMWSILAGTGTMKMTLLLFQLPTQANGWCVPPLKRTMTKMASKQSPLLLLDYITTPMALFIFCNWHWWYSHQVAADVGFAVIAISSNSNYCCHQPMSLLLFLQALFLFIPLIQLPLQFLLSLFGSFCHLGWGHSFLHSYKIMD